jgi:hypothetical protein
MMKNLRKLIWGHDTVLVHWMGWWGITQLALNGGIPLRLVGPRISITY